MANCGAATVALKLGSANPAVLRALVNAALERNLKAPANAVPLLGPQLKSGSARLEAVRLIGVWQLNVHTQAIIKGTAAGRTEPITIRVAAAEALGQLSGPQVAETLAKLTVFNEPNNLRAAALESLARHDVARAARLAAGLVGKVKPDEQGPLMAALLQRKAGADALADELGQKKISADTAKLMLRWLNEVGRVEPKLSAALNKTIGVQAALPVYSAKFVNALAKEALERGDATNGKKVFQLPLISCTACHAVDGVKGAVTTVKGPNLTAVAAGLPVDLLVESVLWPARQIKEGYEANTVVTKDGRVLSGFAHSEDKTLLRIRDLATGKIAPVQTANIQQRTKGGTVMPPGLTASLTRAELRDLIKYLSTLKTTGQPK